MEVPTKEQLKKKKVVELRAELSKLHLPQSGVKDDLIKRLRAHYQEALEQESPTVADNEGDTGAETVADVGQSTPTEETPPANVVTEEPAQDEAMETEDETVESTNQMEVEQSEQPVDSVEQSSHDLSVESHDQRTEPEVVSEARSEIKPSSPTPTPAIEQLPPTVVEQPPPTVVEQPPPTVVEQPPPTKDGGPRTGIIEELKESTKVTDSQLDTRIKETDPPAQVTSDYYSAADSPKKDSSVREEGGNMEASTQLDPEEKGKKKKKKKRRRRKHDQPQPKAIADVSTKENDVKIEYVQEDILQPDDPNYHQFHKIFEAFKLSEMPELTKDPNSVSELVAKAAEASKKLAQQRKYQPQEDEEEEEGEKEPVAMTQKKLRKLNRLTVAQLKQLVERPDVVEMHDVTALDPKLLIHLKSTRNTVPVPRHWCFKRKYLQGKRGIEKPPFNLPDFIKATGVMEMRETQEEKDDAKSLKQKARERIRPKMGKLTIDYQKLHDAFFKFQTKPKMSSHGDLYYEGKEFETRLRQKKPGDLSDELRRSLGMPIGMGKQKFPPPWLVAMQRYGPPPSYPHLKIPGLNAPIPEGCSFGYFVGGWGKPPVDEGGRPLYGDVFGLDAPDAGGVTNEDDETLDKAPWGELESEEEESEEESSEDEAESPKPEDIQAGLVTPMEGLVTPSGLTSIPTGLETPEMIQLRKKKIEEAMEAGGETPTLYTVLPEKTTAVGGGMMGSSHVYDLGATAPAVIRKSGPGGEGVEVALDPSELDLDTATMSARYDAQMKDKNVLQKEDLSDMVAEHAAKQKKRKRATTDSGGKASKKLKEFKF